MKTYIILLLIIVTPFISFSQKAPLKWKKLSKDEINLKIYNNNPNIPAVVLYDYGQMYFDTNPNGNVLFLMNERHVRIKILNKEGLKYAKVKFAYNDMNCERYFGELSFSVKAITHNIQANGKIKQSKLKHKNITYHDSISCVKIAEFEMPNVKVGSIIEYIIKIPSLNIIKPNSWEFQKQIPVIHSEFIARIPDNFKYIFSVKNIKNIHLQDSSYYDQLLNYSFTYRRRRYNSIINLSGTQYRFVNKFMPVLINKKTSERIDIYLKMATKQNSNYAWEKITKPIMITTLESYNRRTPPQRKMLEYPAGYIIYYLPTWEELNENLLFSDKFGLAIIKHWDCDSLLNSIIKNKNTELQKAKAIYNYVKLNMKWNNKYNLYADVSDSFFKKMYNKAGGNPKLNNVGEYFKTGKGTSSEINFVLMHLLNRAKIKVFPVLTNTKTNEVLNKDIALINQFVTVNALVNINGNKYLLDASSPSSSFNKISDAYDKSQMFIIRKENFGWYE